MARLAVRLPVEPVILDDRHPAEDRDAVVHALAVQDDVVVAERAERLQREVAIDDLGLLQAQDVGLLVAQELLDDGDPETDRVDVPGDDLHGRDVALRGGGDKEASRGFGRREKAPSAKPLSSTGP